MGLTLHLISYPPFAEILEQMRALDETCLRFGDYIGLDPHDSCVTDALKHVSIAPSLVRRLEGKFGALVIEGVTPEGEPAVVTLDLFARRDSIGSIRIASREAAS